MSKGVPGTQVINIITYVTNSLGSEHGVRAMRCETCTSNALKMFV